MLAAGFGLGWFVAGPFDPAPGTTLMLGLVGALTCWVVARLVFKLVAFFAGGVTGGVVGAKVYTTFEAGDVDWVIAIIVVLALAIAGGLLVDKFRSRALLWLTSVGGAGVILTGLARVAPENLGFFRQPESSSQHAINLACWIALSLAGWHLQRRFFPRILHVNDKETADS